MSHSAINFDGLDTWRNRLGVRLANTALLITDRDYRNMIAGAIAYGFEAAARDVNADCPPDYNRDHFPCSRQRWSERPGGDAR